MRIIFEGQVLELALMKIWSVFKKNLPYALILGIAEKSRKIPRYVHYPTGCYRVPSTIFDPSYTAISNYGYAENEKQQ